MAYNGNKFLFTHVVPDSSVLPEDAPKPLTEEEQMQLLEERLQEYADGYNPEYKLTYEKTQENGNNGYNIHLPYGIDFRIEHGNITFSKFGLSKDELKNIYDYLHQLGISGLHFDPNEKDQAFVQNVKDAMRELRNEEGLYEHSYVDGASHEPTLPQPANTNIPQEHIDTTGMTDEEAIKARRDMAKQIKKNIRPAIKEEKKAQEEVHPSIQDIESYITAHVKATQKDKSDTYKKIAIGNGYKLMWYKDSDQKREGPKADKSGKVAPNFDAGLKAEINIVNGKPHLDISILTPKFGDAADWVFDEAMGLASTCKVTHLRFKATAAFKGKFLNACGKKMIVPTGIKLKEKEFNAMMKLVKENNDDPIKRAEYYERFAEQLEEDLIKDWQKDKNPNHPYLKMIKNLKIQIAVEKSEEKFKNFNRFYETNIMAKVYTDNSDEPYNTFKVQKKEDKSNVAKELATGKAYVELLTQYMEDPSMELMSHKELQKKYIEFYNKNLYLTHKELRSELRDVRAKKDMKEIINSKYDEVQSMIQAIQAQVDTEGFDKLEVPRLRKIPYYDVYSQERNMKNRLIKGRAIYERENSRTSIPVGRDGGRA